MNQETLINLKPFLYGKLLGDGCIEKPAKSTHNCRFKVKQQIKHREYVEVAFKKLHNFCNKIYLDRSVITYKGIQKEFYAAVCKTRYFPVFTQMRKEWYSEDGVKGLPDDLEQYFTAETLAYWYMDDGYLNQQYRDNKFKSAGCVIFTDCFTEIQVDRLVSIINNKFDLAARKVFTPHYTEKNKKACFRIRIGKLEKVQKLFSIIDPYVVSCMKYKTTLQWIRQ